MSDLTIHFAGLSDVGHSRHTNEDSFELADLSTGKLFGPAPVQGRIDVGARGALLALSDGMGGHAAGEVASALVINSLRTALLAAAKGGAQDRLEAAVRHANADVIAAAQTKGQQGMGATLTAVLVDQTVAYVAEVGDSRAYLLRAGKLKQLTRDQSLVQFLVDSGVMSQDEADDSPQKNILLQAMGTGHDVQAAIGQVALRRGDKLLICSDGISNAITPDELLQILNGFDPWPACSELVKLANDRGGLDNLTAVVATFDGERLDPPAFAETVTATFAVLKDFGSK